MLRGNLLASAIGTVVGNPWTFPFIWAWIYTLGGWLLGEARLQDLPVDLTLSYIFDNPMSVLWPMAAGGVLTAIVAWFAFFWPAKLLVAQYQHARYRRLRKKVVKRRAEEAAARFTGHEAENEG